MNPSDQGRPTRVGIGLIRRGDSYLIRIRPAGSVMAGCWEFPGGKCEVGESPAQATARECLEEVGVEVVIGELFGRILHRYPHGLVELHYYRGTTRGEPDPDSGFVWIPSEDLPSYRFPEANGPIIEALSREAARSRGSGRD